MHDPQIQATRTMPLTALVSTWAHRFANFSVSSVSLAWWSSTDSVQMTAMLALPPIAFSSR